MNNKYFLMNEIYKLQITEQLRERALFQLNSFSDMFMTLNDLFVYLRNELREISCSWLESYNSISDEETKSFSLETIKTLNRLSIEADEALNTVLN